MQFDNTYGYNALQEMFLTPDGKLHAIYRQESMEVYATDPPRPVPPRYSKEIYGVQDGKIVLEKIVQAKVTPAQEQKVEWPND